LTKDSYLSDIRSEYKSWLNENDEILARIFTWAMIVDNKAIISLKKLTEQKRSYKLFKTMGRIPNFSKLSKKQKLFIPKWPKNVYRGDYLICRTLRHLEEIEILKELQALDNRQLDSFLKESLLNARKLHHLGFFDAAIIICGKITEYLLKERLNRDSISFDEKWGIFKLFKKFQSSRKQQKPTKEIIKHVQEVIRNLRNLNAHGNPKSASESDSNLVWHSLLFLINELTF
jgi:hypothetical protein